MQKNLKPLKNLKFFLGTDNYEENNSILDSYVYYSKNARFNKKVIGSKQGYEALGQLQAGGTKWQGMYEYPYFDGLTTTKKLIGLYNKTFYEFNETTQLWVAITTNWPNLLDGYVDAVPMANCLYLTGLCDNTASATQNVFTFTVAGIVVTPVLGAIYTIGGISYVIIGTNIVTGSGTLLAIRQNSAVNPTATGTLSSASLAAGDAAINYSLFAKSAQTDGVGKIFSGVDFTFTVSNVVIVPAINSVYQLNGVQYIVTSTSINSSGVGTIIAKRQLSLVDAPATGVLSAVSGALYYGDSTITYSAYVKAAQSSTAFTIITNSPQGQAIESFGERLVVVGIPFSPGMIVMSAPITQPGQDFKIENFLYLVSLSGSLTFFTKKGGSHRAMRVINTDIYYWTDNGVFQQSMSDIAAGINPNQLARTTSAVNQKSTIIVENDVWFFNTQNEVRSLGNERNLGENPRTKSVSEIIKKTMQSLDANQDNPVMSYNQRILKLSLKTKGSPTNNITLIFDYNTGGFGVDLGQGINVACIWKNMRIYGEDSSGQAFKDDVGYSANGSSFAFEVDLPFYDNSRPDLFNEARYIYVRGKQSYYQPLTIRLFRGNYSTYSDYLIDSPQNRGVVQASPGSNGAWGTAQQGNAPWGGSSTDPTDSDIQLYQFEELISISRISNMFAIGLIAAINGGKVEVEQIILKVVDQNENYKRSDL